MCPEDYKCDVGTICYIRVYNIIWNSQHAKTTIIDTGICMYGVKFPG